MRLPMLAVCTSLMLSACAADTWREVASDAGEFVAEQSLRLAADAVRSKVQPLLVEGRISASDAAEALQALDVVSDFDMADSDNDGFVDGSKISVSLAGRSMCVDFSSGSGLIADGVCSRP